MSLVLMAHICSFAQDNKNKSKKKNDLKEITLESSVAPFPVEPSSVKFYANVSYGKYERNVLDIFCPSSDIPSPFVIIIHGGGFVRGEKEKPYTTKSFQQLVNHLLEKNIAVALINYRFVEKDDTEGILKSMEDSKRALQFLRAYSKDFDLKKEKVVLMGSSAGAGTSLWIGLSDEMAIADSKDPVLRESTRVSGLVCTETQATYNFLKWASVVFLPYQENGFSYTTIESIMDSRRINSYLGISSSDLMSTPRVERYLNKVDFLSLLDSADPEMYVANEKVPYTIPLNTSELYHHALHAKALMDAANLVGARGEFYIPQIEVDTRNGESIEGFILRILTD